MNMNKKLDRLKQWAGERMGGEAKTSVSDEFKALEVEMDLRYEGMVQNQKSMTSYVKAMSLKKEGEDREKNLPVGHMGSTMVTHGEDFEHDSEFGRCLIAMGQTQERIARAQESYILNATSSWLESLERSLAQMKEYQAARKKLENRRLAYDAALAKMQKAKKEDFRVEEDLRAQKAKYEETSEDVFRRMQDIKEAEIDSVNDLGEFVAAEFNYYDRCRDLLLQLKDDWPADNGGQDRKIGKPKSTTAHTYADRFAEPEPEPPAQPERPSIRSSRSVSSQIGGKDTLAYEAATARPGLGRSSTVQSSRTTTRDTSPPSAHMMNRTPSDSLTMRPQRSQLRAPPRVMSASRDTSDDLPDHLSSPFYDGNSVDRFVAERSASPANSVGSSASRTASSGKKPPPPPPPSRASKPPPPPPPMKRSTLTNMSYA